MRKVITIDVSKMSHAEAKRTIEQISGRKLPSYNYISWAFGIFAVAQLMQIIAVLAK
jgi:hypothetical protein